MGKARTVLSILSVSPYIVRLILYLLTAWLTLGWKVRKTRKAFEKELVKQGMSKEDAKRLSAQYKILKNNLSSGLKHFIRTG